MVLLIVVRVRVLGFVGNIRATLCRNFCRFRRSANAESRVIITQRHDSVAFEIV